MKKATDKFIGFFKLIESMKLPGCPVCERIRRDTQHSIDSFLYESVNDAGLRAQIRDDRGLCPRHSWQLAAAGDALGGAIVFNDVLESVVASLAKWSRNAQPADMHCANCIFCRCESKTHQSSISDLAVHCNDAEVSAAWGGPAALCVEHLAEVCRRLSDPADRRRLIDIHRDKYALLCRAMSSLIAKQSYDRRADEISPDEKQSWLRAAEMLAGKSGVR